MNRKQEKAAQFDQGYSVAVTGRHVDVTEAMKNHAIEKISKLERLGKDIIDVVVTMDIQKLEHRVDVVMKYGHTMIKSSAVSNDMYASTDLVVHKIASQIRKYKSRLQDHHAKGHPVAELPVVFYREAISEDDINKAIEAETERQLNSFPHHEIVHRDTQPLKILTDIEAIMKMDLSGAPVMVYRDEITNNLRVIYTCDESGNYGIIQLEK